MNPEEYEAWYHTPKGQWIGKCEISLLMRLMQPIKGSTLLDVGSGTGYFSREFSNQGLVVNGIDPDLAMIDFSRKQSSNINYIEGVAENLPFKDNSFDYCAAVTSLCFVEEPEEALAEMWRVSRKGVILGLLNRYSLLYKTKHGKGSYIGARWDTWQNVKDWLALLQPYPCEIKRKTTVFIPGDSILPHLAESLLPGRFPFGGFLAIYLRKDNIYVS